jgi:hypothetical protein
LTDLDRVSGQREFKKLLPLFQLIGNQNPLPSNKPSTWSWVKNIRPAIGCRLPNASP